MFYTVGIVHTHHYVCKYNEFVNFHKNLDFTHKNILNFHVHWRCISHSTRLMTLHVHVILYVWMYLSLAWWAELDSQGFPLEEVAYHSQRKGVGLHQQGLHLGPTDQTGTLKLIHVHNSIITVIMMITILICDNFRWIKIC